MTNEFIPKPPAREPDPLDPNVPLDPAIPGLKPVPSVAGSQGLPPVPSVADASGIPPVPQVATTPPPTTVRTGLGGSWADAVPEPDDLQGGPGKAQDGQPDAGALRRQGMESARQVAGTAKEEAAHVAEEAKQQATDLVGELTSDLREQAALQQEKIAHNLRSISNEFRSMAESSSEQGTAVSWVRQAGQRAGGMADWLGDRDPGSLVAEVKGFARQRPGTFLALAAGAGLLAGRLARGVAGASSDEAASDAGPARGVVDAPMTSETPVPRQDTLGREISGSGLRVNPAGASEGVRGAVSGTGFGVAGTAGEEKGFPTP